MPNGGYGVGNRDRNIHYRNRIAGIEPPLDMFSIDEALEKAGFSCGPSNLLRTGE